MAPRRHFIFYFFNYFYIKTTKLKTQALLDVQQYRVYNILGV